MISIDSILVLNHYLAVLGLVSLFFTIAIIADVYLQRKLERLMNRFGLLIAFFTAMTGTLMALFYSEVVGLIPCGLCWIERMFLFPQVALLGLAFIYRDVLIARYGILLSSLGLTVSLYHHYVQMGGTEFIKCPASGGDCAKRYIFEFDFVTFPLLAVFTFAFLIAVYVYVLKTRPAHPKS